MTYDLSFYQAHPNETTRVFPIEPHEYRDDFQRDRDRILYSKEFRRLSGKTQIFVAGSDDHMRTRLTHTLEVEQIADTIARRLHLNVMLTSAIAYAHDIGHTPFGHAGERTLNYIMNGCFSYYGYDECLETGDKGFKHNLQGVRVASHLEKMDNEKEPGLNLTRYTLWGIQNHTSRAYKKCEYSSSNLCQYKNCHKSCSGLLSLDYYNKSLSYLGRPIIDDRRDWTFEAIVVAYADEIAQRHHDIEDGIYAGIIDVKHLYDYLLNDPVYKQEAEKIELIDYKDKDSASRNIRILSRMIVNFYVSQYSKTLAEKIENLSEVLHIDKQTTEAQVWRDSFFDYVEKKHKSLNGYFGYNDDLVKADTKFGKYLKNHVVFSELAQSMDGKADFIIKQLIKAYLTNPQQLPDKTIISVVDDWYYVRHAKAEDEKTYMTRASAARDTLKDLLNSNDPLIKKLLIRRICDFIAGMTDQYAFICFEELYGIKQGY